jgi:ubiquinone/menaquinone biosynthesis C-methylase UbiE
MLTTSKKEKTSLWDKPLLYQLLQATLGRGGHSTIHKYLLDNITDHDQLILDVGCGTGEYSLLFKGTYTGIDYSTEYIEYARSKYKGNFIVNDATKLEFESNKFDVVFSVGLHHHLSNENAKKAITEALRVTKPKGKLIIVDAMLPKNKLNIVGLLLRKMDRGKNVRPAPKTVGLLPPTTTAQTTIISSYPFDYIAIKIKK